LQDKEKAIYIDRRLKILGSMNLKQSVDKQCENFQQHNNSTQLMLLCGLYQTAHKYPGHNKVLDLYNFRPSYFHLPGQNRMELR